VHGAGRELALATPALCLFYLGINTVSMAWITPLSAATALAPFTIAPPMVLPCTVVTLPTYKSVHLTLPETTRKISTTLSLSKASRPTFAAQI
jgi:hypothetical protein